MQSIIDFFNGNPWLNILFLLLSIISIILAFIFYFKSIREKKLVYSKNNFQLVSDKLSALKNIEIKYKDVTVKNLTLTKFAVWNSGKEPIKKSDFAPTDPLEIFGSEGIIIYDFEIFYHSPINDIKISRLTESKLNLSFEFLDFNQGVILHIYHNGKKNDALSIKGTIIGAQAITHGIKKNVFTNKADILTTPINHLMNHKNVFARILGWVVGLPFTIAILIPLLILLLPFDYINEKFINKVPPDFNLINQ